MDRQPLPKGFTARATNIRVIDGDSIECDFKRQRVRVRLYGIDAPELGQPGGADSADNLAAMTRRGALMMEVMSYDRYGRLVGLLYPARRNRRDSLNLRMAREGQAYAYTRFGGAELGMRSVERDAQMAGRGIWRSSRDGVERPWEYRRRSREPSGSLPMKWLLIVLFVLLLILGLAGLAVVGLGFDTDWLSL